jgi:hypothetical protein
MIRASAVVALAVASLLAGCQVAQNVPAGPPPIDGQWASGDGISVTTFQGGQLATRFVQTNELLAQGSYTMAGNNISMQYLSIRSQANVSATCSLTSPTTMQCSQPNGTSFSLNRVG